MSKANGKPVPSPAQPKAYGYSRVSGEQQFKSGSSLDAQPEACYRYWQDCLTEKGIAWADNYQEPKGTSAFKTPFPKRPAGKKLLELLQSGDHLIVDKVDRLWRTVHDFATLLQLFKEREITLHFCNMFGVRGVDMSTAMGSILLTFMVGLAEMESRVKSERMKDIFGHRKATGQQWTAQNPYGYMWVGKRPNRRLKINQAQRNVGAKIVEYREAGMNWTQLTKKINQELLGDAYRSTAWQPKPLFTAQSQKYYDKELELRAQGK